MLKTIPYTTVNTCTRCPAFPQIVSYLIFFLQLLVFFLLVQPFLTTLSKQVTIVLYSLTLSVQVISTLITSAIDPVDHLMRNYRNGQGQLSQTEMQLSLHCENCRSYVSRESRHCRACDRCVKRFDHHCVWINNCVGETNYRAFFVMIVSTLLNMLVYMTSVVLLYYEEAQLELWMIIAMWAIFAVVGVFAVLLINLVLLHIYLQCKGLTTFDFIMLRREREQAQIEMQEREKRQWKGKQSERRSERKSERRSEMKNEKQEKFERTQETLNHEEEHKSKQVIFLSGQLKTEEKVSNEADKAHYNDEPIGAFLGRHRSLKVMVGLTGVDVLPMMKSASHKRSRLAKE